MKISHLLLVILIAAVTAIGAQRLLPQNNAVSATAETAYDRIKATSTIRCGYGVWEGTLAKDPTTGELSGLAYDYVNALGKALSLKVEWVEDTGWNEAVPALLTARIDVFCAGTWPNGARARDADFTIPHVYNAIYGYVREGDTRFDTDRTALNDPSIKVASPDGYTAARIAEAEFPKAAIYSVVSNTSAAEQLESVATGKADITFVDAIPGAEYMAANPGKIKQLPGGPLRVSPVTLFIKAGDYRLKRMLDIATEEMLNSGIIDKLVTKNEKYPGTYSRVLPGYQQR